MVPGGGLRQVLQVGVHRPAGGVHRAGDDLAQGGHARQNADLPSDMNAVINGTYDVAKTDAVEERAKTNYGYTNGLYTNNGDYDDFEPGEHYLELSRTEEDLVELVCSSFDKVIVVINANNAMELDWGSCRRAGRRSRRRCGR